MYNEWAKADTEYLKFIETMKNNCFSIRFNIETVKCYINCKSQWYSNLREKTIYPLNEKSVVSNERIDLINGIRELNEGLFKYQEDGSNLEISDRMLFIGATSLKNQIKMDEFVIDKQLNKCNFKTEREINEIIRDIRTEITPNFNLKNKKLNSYMAKRIPKPKPNWFE